MESTKFEIGQIVKYKGDNVTVVTHSKNFISKTINYRLDNDVLISEADLILENATTTGPAPEFKEPTTTEPKKEVELTIEDLKATYKTLIGKNVPPNKSKDVEWIKSKIKEAQPTKEAYETFAALEYEQLVEVIQRQELDIDPNDYTTQAELLKALCEELEIAIPA